MKRKNVLLSLNLIIHFKFCPTDPTSRLTHTTHQVWADRFAVRRLQKCIRFLDIWINRWYIKSIRRNIRSYNKAGLQRAKRSCDISAFDIVIGTLSLNKMLPTVSWRSRTGLVWASAILFLNWNLGSKIFFFYWVNCAVYILFLTFTY